MKSGSLLQMVLPAAGLDVLASHVCGALGFCPRGAAGSGCYLAGNCPTVIMPYWFMEAAAKEVPSLAIVTESQ